MTIITTCRLLYLLVQRIFGYGKDTMEQLSSKLVATGIETFSSFHITTTTKKLAVTKEGSLLFEAGQLCLFYCL